MKLVVCKNHLGGQIVYRILTPLKKRRHRGIMFGPDGNIRSIDIGGMNFVQSQPTQRQPNNAPPPTQPGQVTGTGKQRFL